MGLLRNGGGTGTEWYFLYSWVHVTRKNPRFSSFFIFPIFLCSQITSSLTQAGNTKVLLKFSSISVSPNSWKHPRCFQFLLLQFRPSLPLTGWDYFRRLLVCHQASPYPASLWLSHCQSDELCQSQRSVESKSSIFPKAPKVTKGFKLSVFPPPCFSYLLSFPSHCSHPTLC